MDGPRRYNAKWNKSEKDNYMWKLKKTQLNKPNRNKPAATESVLMVAKGKAGGRDGQNEKGLMDWTTGW